MMRNLTFSILIIISVICIFTIVACSKKKPDTTVVQDDNSGVAQKKQPVTPKPVEVEEKVEEPEIDIEIGKCYDKAVRLFEMNSYDDAIGWFTKVIKKDPANVESYCYCGRAYYEKGIKAKPDNALASEGYFTKVIENMTRVLELQPDNAIALEYRGMAHYEIGSHFKLATEDFSRLIELSPKRAMLYFRRGLAFNQGGYSIEAIDDYMAALKLDPDITQAYRKLWWLFKMSRDSETAIKFCDELVNIHFKHASPYYLRGLVYFNNEEYTNALEDFNRALGINPEYPEALEWQQKTLDKLEG
ncbi:tetratricopeptide repeat protein [bacterium]|nr:tetratricopeptide repeat protein [bacterium]